MGPGVDVEELGVHIGKLGGTQVGDTMEYAGSLSVRACGEARDLPRAVAAELGLGWSDQASR